MILASPMKLGISRAEAIAGAAGLSKLPPIRRVDASGDLTFVQRRILFNTERTLGKSRRSDQLVARRSAWQPAVQGRAIDCQLFIFI
jgi:hypothetical protein